MFRRIALVLGPLALVTLALAAQHTHSPYAGEQSRDLKALSEKEIASYLAGEGMGFAKSAELNSYPGPRHVLEAAEQLGLSDTQRETTQRVFDEMQAEAKRLGAAIVAKEAALERAFRGRAITDAKLREMLAELARLQGELRYAHLEAHLLTKNLLSREQIAKYDKLRGYGSSTTSDGGHRH
jgi:Spy/CpxP family protein refolding chaperone